MMASMKPRFEQLDLDHNGGLDAKELAAAGGGGGFRPPVEGVPDL